MAIAQCPDQTLSEFPNLKLQSSSLISKIKCSMSQNQRRLLVVDEYEPVEGSKRYRSTVSEDLAEKMTTFSRSS
ncbi:hypothetical protein O6P43_016630 [Quillaja saponaria]|uniref:Uncharacterized protein n=1 Tax=Quillaja saponaria TaxID=32244 RepID=A0AAD7LN79_QUISA|nr:hypothetical protein O6P43_016630 [Quillaja saponaria]